MSTKPRWRDLKKKIKIINSNNKTVVQLEELVARSKLCNPTYMSLGDVRIMNPIAVVSVSTI